MQDNIIIGFSKPKKFHILSWLIQKIDRTEFSHVYLKIHSKSIQRDLIYQASGLSVNFCGIRIFNDKNESIIEFIIIITPEEKIEILKLAVDLAGKPYGMKELIGIGIVRFLGLFNKKIKNPYADGSKTYICSELAATILLKLNFKFEELDSVTPKEIYEKLSKKD